MTLNKGKTKVEKGRAHGPEKRRHKHKRSGGGADTLRDNGHQISWAHGEWLKIKDGRERTNYWDQYEGATSKSKERGQECYAIVKRNIAQMPMSLRDFQGCDGSRLAN